LRTLCYFSCFFAGSKYSWICWLDWSNEAEENSCHFVSAVIKNFLATWLHHRPLLSVGLATRPVRITQLASFCTLVNWYMESTLLEIGCMKMRKYQWYHYFHESVILPTKHFSCFPWQNWEQQPLNTTNILGMNNSFTELYKRETRIVGRISNAYKLQD
jgi:hypothetical protein